MRKVSTRTSPCFDDQRVRSETGIGAVKAVEPLLSGSREVRCVSGPKRT